MIELRENYWAVEVPSDAGPANILTAFQPNTLSYEYSVEKAERCETGLIAMIELPPGTWHIICTLKDATYTQAAQIVERDGDGFKDYDKDNFHHDLPFMSPFESLRSLMTAKGCDVSKNFLIIKKG